MATSSSLLRVEGAVEESLPGLLFRVKTEVKGETRTVLAHLAGRLKIHHIRVIPGDRVLIEMVSPTDERGRIIRRL